MMRIIFDDPSKNDAARQPDCDCDCACGDKTNEARVVTMPPGREPQVELSVYIREDLEDFVRNQMRFILIQRDVIAGLEREIRERDKKLKDVEELAL